MQGSNGRERWNDERGASLVVMVTGLLVALLGITGLVIDLGMARRERGTLQAMVDASSLAGSYSLNSTIAGGGVAEALDTASTYASKNLDAPKVPAICPAGVEPDTQCFTIDAVTIQVTPRSDEPGEPISRIHMRACEDVDTSFMKVFGWERVLVCADSTARKVRKGLPPSPPGILVLGKAKEEVAGKKGTHKALHTHGYIKVSGQQGKPGVLQVDSKHVTDAALIHDKKSTTIADQIRVVGGTKIKAGAKICSATQITPPFLCLASPLVFPADVMGDPLEELKEPPIPSSFPGETKNSDSKKVKVITCDVGQPYFNATHKVCWYGKIKADNGGVLELHGPYPFVVNGIEVKDRDGSKSSEIRTKDTMLFNVGKVTVNDGGELHLTAMSLNQAKAIGYPDYADIALFQARCRTKDIGTEKCDAVNAKGQKILLKGKKKNASQASSWSFTGTIYAPNSKLEVKGDVEDEDPASLEDIDESNDPNEPDDEDPFDPEADMTFSKSAIIVGELVVGKKGSIVVDTMWPAAAGYLNPTSSLVE